MGVGIIYVSRCFVAFGFCCVIVFDVFSGCGLWVWLLMGFGLGVTLWWLVFRGVSFLGLWMAWRFCAWVFPCLNFLWWVCFGLEVGVG